MPTILLIRHAESKANAGGRTADPAQIGLTERGLAQAACLAEAFKHQPDLVITSPYLRTKLTARPLLARFGNLQQAEWAVQEFTYLSPERCRDTTFQERRPLADQYWDKSDPFACNGSGTESFVDFMKRVEYFMGQAVLLKNDCTAVFSHGQFIRAVIWRLLTGKTGASSSEMKQFRDFLSSFEIFNASTIKLQVETDNALWVGAMDIRYMSQELLT